MLMAIHCFLQLIGAVLGLTRYAVDDFDPMSFAAYADTVQFFYLVSPFPYNTPSNIV